MQSVLPAPSQNYGDSIQNNYIAGELLFNYSMKLSNSQYRCLAALASFQ